MTFLEIQTDILEKLANILYNSFDGVYEYIVCEYNYIDRFKTIGVTVSVSKNGIETYVEPPVGFATRSIDFCEELREIMNRSTGGLWKSFTLKIDAAGKAHTKFQY